MRKRTLQIALCLIWLTACSSFQPSVETTSALCESGGLQTTSDVKAWLKTPLTQNGKLSPQAPQGYDDFIRSMALLQTIYKQECLSGNGGR